MKKKFALDNFEKAALLIAALLIPITGLLGFYKMSTSKKDVYVSSMKSETASGTSATASDELKLKKKTFTIKANGSLDTKVSEYLEGPSEKLEKVKLDLSNVKMDEPGSYSATATYEKNVFKFTVKVEESENPVIKAENTSFRFLVGKYSTIDEVKEIAGVKAVDKDGNDITKDITGWPETFPIENGKVEYRLQAADSYGNTGHLSITIDFEKVVQ